jgi:excinuclease ABC subunit C
LRPSHYFFVENPDLGKISHSPGVYLFKNSAGDTLYVGKAKDLKKRLHSYFKPNPDFSPKNTLMMSRAKTFEVIVTVTEKEALILENSLIKDHRPKFNIAWRDDKTYPYIKIDNEGDFPRLLTTRKRLKDNAMYFGPYTSSLAIRETLKSLCQLFGLRTCSDHYMINRDRPCLKHQINRCSAPCKRKISKDEYLDKIRQAKLFLDGKTGNLISELKVRMEKASDDLFFEKAAELRDRVSALENLSKQNVIIDIFDDIDVIGVGKGSKEVIVVHMRIREGALRGKEVYNLDMALDEETGLIISAFIRQYYLNNSLPQEILVPELPGDCEALIEWFKEDFSKSVKLRTGIRDVRKRLLNMANENANEAVQAIEEKDQKDLQKVELLYNTIPLKHKPIRIEAVDISNTGGELSVGSLVCYVDGKPYKKGYRHYAIKGVEGINDFAMIREVVTRRFRKGNTEYPDLLLIDGGTGQLNQAVEVLREQGLLDKFDVLSIAKGKRNEPDRIIEPSGNALDISHNSRALLFLMEIRDEAHRFGITHHRNKRGKLLVTSVIDNISDVGPKRKRALLTHFGGVTGLQSATIEEISKVSGISENLAQTIYDFFNKD